MHEEHDFSDLFLKLLSARSMRAQADLVDRLFQLWRKAPDKNSPIVGAFGQPGEPETPIPFISGYSGGDNCHHPVTRQLFLIRIRKLQFRKHSKHYPTFALLKVTQ